MMSSVQMTKSLLVFFFNDTATTEIYTLSLHDALPIWIYAAARGPRQLWVVPGAFHTAALGFQPVEFRRRDRKSTRLNSSHGYISYAVFCLKKKKRIARSLSFIREVVPHDRYRPGCSRH